MAKQTPRAVQLSSSVPVWHAGQFPRIYTYAVGGTFAGKGW